MDKHLSFIDFSGLNEPQAEALKDLLKPTLINTFVEFPWSTNFCEGLVKGDIIKDVSIMKGLHCPAAFMPSSEPPQHCSFEVLVPGKTSIKSISCTDYKVPVTSHLTSNTSYKNTSYCKSIQHSTLQTCELNANGVNDKPNANSENQFVISNDANSKAFESVNRSTLPSSNFTPENHVQNVRSFVQPCGNVIHSALNPLVSCFVPKSSVVPQTSAFLSSVMPSTNLGSMAVDKLPTIEMRKDLEQNVDEKCEDQNSNLSTVNSSTMTENKLFDSQNEKRPIENSKNTCIIQEKDVQNASLQKKEDLPNLNGTDQTSPAAEVTLKEVVSSVPQKQTASTSPSWADVLKSKSNKKMHQNSPVSSSAQEKGSGTTTNKDAPAKEDGILTSAEKDIRLTLGRHLHDLNLDFTPVLLQPRGLVNRRNWCYINATLQALIACSPFYTFLRNLPLGPGIERGKSSTPVLDSMVKLIYEFAQVPALQEDMQPGQPFQPTHIYDMLSVLKPDCIKGQQEDAEEFLSYILNGMHEEMALALKSYEETYNINDGCEVRTNGHIDTSESEDEWKVMGSRQRGVVTRLVVERKSPISDLLGGQIKSFLTINGSNSSASIQPFFTLQLDIQAETVTTVLEALNQMIVKEPIHGYTCPKTKQEVEAYSRSTLQKIPPILILHLKRFIYDKNGGCKKVMKKTEYPINLELKKDLFSPEAKKARRFYSYTLFAVMYHDGEEAMKGHYISDIYHHGSKSWIRCDDRSITTISENQVLSYNPPRVPYLLFYQVNSSLQDTKL